MGVRRISWDVWVGFSAPNRLPFGLQSLSRLRSIVTRGCRLFCWPDEGGRAHGSPQGWLLPPAWLCRQPPRLHPAGFLELINVPPRGSPCLAQPGSFSVCFHPVQTHLPLVSRGLISSNGWRLSLDGFPQLPSAGR